MPGSGGSVAARRATRTSASTPAAAKAACQLANEETKAAAGTPSTDATDTPDRMTEVARPTDRSGTSRAPRPAAKAQNPPMLTPVSTRAASMTR